MTASRVHHKALSPVHVALGSNLGTDQGGPARMLAHAAGAVRAACSSGPASGPAGGSGTEAWAASSLWASEAVGFTGPAFVNAVVRFETRLSPTRLLSRLQDIERNHGRIRELEAGYHARIIDLDIIDYAGLLIKQPQLSIPHPRAGERLFVLLPLQEVSPDFRFPGAALSLPEMIKRAPPISITRVGAVEYPEPP